jgi:hypothetical protein
MAESVAVYKYTVIAATIESIVAIILYFYTPTKTVTSHHQCLNSNNPTRKTQQVPRKGRLSVCGSRGAGSGI